MSMRPLNSIKIIVQYTSKLGKKVQVGKELQKPKDSTVNKTWTGSRWIIPFNKDDRYNYGSLYHVQLILKTENFFIC